MSFCKRQGSDAVCYTKPLDSLKGWNDHFFWIDAFACPALLLWHTGKSVSRDVIPKSSEFSPEDYATLVAYPAPFHKYPKPFLCLVGMSRNYTLDENTYPQFLRKDDEDRNRFAFLYPYCRSYEVRIGERQRDDKEPKLLETTVGRVVLFLPVAPDRSSGELEASVEKLFGKGGGGGQAKQGDFASGGHGVGIDVVAETSVEDHLLVGAVQNTEVKGGVMPTFPFVSSFVSTTPEREGGDYTELLVGANLRTIGSLQRFVISSDSSDHSGVNIAEAEVDSIVRTFIPIITSATTTTPTVDPVVMLKRNLLVLLYLQQIILPRAEVILFLAANLIYLAATSSLAAEKSLRDEVTALNKRNTILEKERNALDVKVTDLQAVVVSKDRELTNSAAQLASIKSHNDNLADQVHELQVPSFELKEKLSNYENLTERLEEFQDAQLKVVNDKFDKLYADFFEVTLYLEERFYPHLLTTIARRIWLLTHGMKFVIAKYLHSLEYLSALGTAVRKAIEKGMQDGLAAGITRGREGRVLTDVAAHNPAAEADNVFALQQLQTRLGLNESQPHADQLMVPIHHSLDKTVVGAFALSLALDILDARV
nr:transposase (putative), gypsy type [Tanacetum cinerariifolium]